MRAAVRVALSLFVLSAATAAGNTPPLTVPTAGSAAERVQTLWTATRPRILEDASQPLSDAQLVARGSPLIDAWTSLETSLGDADDGDVHAVLKFLGDLYGREQSSPQRRSALRNDARQTFGMRLDRLEQRLKD